MPKIQPMPCPLSLGKCVSLLFPLFAALKKKKKCVIHTQGQLCVCHDVKLPRSGSAPGQSEVEADGHPYHPPIGPVR